MILQRELPVPIWGTAASGEKLTLSFAGQRLETTADEHGRWMIKLKPLKTSKTGQEMIVSVSNTIALSDVLVGEVWLCSGQSNMAGKFSPTKGPITDSKIPEKNHSGLRFLSKNGVWESFTPSSQRRCSRIAYYFGLKLYKELDIPIGLIIRATSGSPIQSWMPAVEAEEIRKELAIAEHWGDPLKPNTAATQYDAWIDNLIPITFRGVIWYQGERNAKTQTGWEYRWLLPRLIRCWREIWAERAAAPLREFPLYYVQVPCQGGKGIEWPWLRDAMRRALDLTKNTGMAVVYDCGPAVHPPHQQIKVIGERFALLALARDYGRKDLVHCGPLLDEVAIKGDKAVLRFKHAGSGLKNKAGGDSLPFFEIAGKDGKYVSADAWIRNDTVIVHSSEISSPVHVRYLFKKTSLDPKFSLMNTEGLPASPFMTDEFKPTRQPLPEPSEAQKRAIKKRRAKGRATKRKHRS
jgi:sialate O-acetylesterase